MTCFHPVKCYKSINKQPTGKYAVQFKVPEDLSNYQEIRLPCGGCIGCRITRSKMWALRCVHEASLFDFNTFITLTFNNENLSNNLSLIKSDFQNFMKSLRKEHKGVQLVKVNGKDTYPIRYFHCGEYGSKLLRPHHHACLFNFDFPDKVLWNVKEGIKLYRSKILEDIWGKGFCTLGDVNYQTAAYVARYCMKKVTGKNSILHYTTVNLETGELELLQPEYITMSRRPGIARRWYDKYKNTDLYNKDYVTHQGAKHQAPKYYDKIYDIEYPEQMEQIKKIRVDKSKQSADNNIRKRLKARESFTEQKLKPLVRSYENETEALLNPGQSNRVLLSSVSRTQSGGRLPHVQRHVLEPSERVP